MDILKDFVKLMKDKYNSKGMYPVLNPFGSGVPCFELEINVATKKDLKIGTTLQVRRCGYDNEDFGKAYMCLMEAADIILAEVNPAEETYDFFKGYDRGWEYKQNYKGEGEDKKSDDYHKGRLLKEKVDAHVKAYAKKEGLR